MAYSDFTEIYKKRRDDEEIADIANLARLNREVKKLLLFDELERQNRLILKVVPLS